MPLVGETGKKKEEGTCKPHSGSGLVESQSQCQTRKRRAEEQDVLMMDEKDAADAHFQSCECDLALGRETI